MSTEIDELKQARYRSGKTISGHNAFLRPPTGETNSVDTRGFYFVLKEPHPFDFDKSDIRPDQVPRVEADASWLKEHRGLKFRIEGHCDERGSEEYNLALGDRRANRVKEFLISKGIDTSSINTISYGEERPVCREATED